jgi:hypothetical protein
MDKHVIRRYQAIKNGVLFSLEVLLVRRNVVQFHRAVCSCVVLLSKGSPQEEKAVYFGGNVCL